MDPEQNMINSKAFAEISFLTIEVTIEVGAAKSHLFTVTVAGVHQHCDHAEAADGSHTCSDIKYERISTWLTEKASRELMKTF